MEAFLFDLDGLLVDSEPLHFEAFKTVCEKSGFSIPWDFKTYCQKAHTQSMGLKKAFLDMYPDAETLWATIYHKVKLHFSNLVISRPLPMIPGALEFINLLIEHHKKLAVVTNSSTPMVLAMIEKQPGLKQIPLWITREDYTHPKPAPDGYLKALSLLEIEPAKAWGFEDSLRGLKALKAAGVKACHISPFPQGEDIHFSDFNQLLNSSLSSNFF
jgi:HAD superfamily hydrolase (TIGR01509 family)